MGYTETEQELHQLRRVGEISDATTEKKKRLLLLATGGTIASGSSGQGLEPEYTIRDILKTARPLADFYDLDARDILSLDSSNIQPEEWVLIAEEIVDNAASYDGVIVTHGTDTMAYTASVLSFMLQGIEIPVVLTGSQLPVTEALSDAPMNLAAALAMAASGEAGVFVAFGGLIILGARAVKTHTTQFRAFDSVNREPLARVDGRGLHFNEEERKALRACRRQGGLEARLTLCPEVFLLKLTPGLRPEIFDHLLDMGYRGLVIEAFGIGGIHSLHRDLIQGLTKFLKRGIPVVVTSQCLYEHSDFSLYATGRKLLAAGAIEAFDMTTEAAITKLIWALGQGMDAEACRILFQENLAGELGRREQ